MNSRKDFHQGDVIMMNFDPTKGHEQNGYRPALVVSNDDFNMMCGGVIKVAAITSNEKEFPLHVEIPAGLPVHGVIELDHERSIDSQSRARKCKYVCSVPSEFLDEILRKLALTYKKSR